MPGRLTTAGAVGIGLVVKPRNFITGTQKATAAVRRHQYAMAQLNTQYQSIRRSSRRLIQDYLRNASITLALAFATRAAVREFIKFDSALVRQRSLVGLTERSVRGFRQEILRLAPTLARGPAELAEGLFFLTSAGLRGTTALQALRASSEAAAIGLGEVKTIADAVATAVNAYGSEALSARLATAILVATVREGKLEAEELAPQLGRVVAIAQELGVEFHEVGAAYAALSRTQRTEQATVALVGLLKPLLKPTEQAGEALARMGLTIEQLRDNISRRGLFSSLNELRENITRFGVNLGDLFRDQYGIIGLLSLTGSNFERTNEIANRLAITTEQDLKKAFDITADSVEHRMRSALTKLNIQLDRASKVAIPAFAENLHIVSALLIAIPGALLGGILFKGLTTLLGVGTRLRVTGTAAEKAFSKIASSARRATARVVGLRATLALRGEFGRQHSRRLGRILGGGAAFTAGAASLQGLLGVSRNAKELEDIAVLAQAQLRKADAELEKVNQEIIRLVGLQEQAAKSISTSGRRNLFDAIFGGGRQAAQSSFGLTEARRLKELQVRFKEVLKERDALVADSEGPQRQARLEQRITEGIRDQEDVYKRLLDLQRGRVREALSVADVERKVTDTVDQQAAAALTEREAILGGVRDAELLSGIQRQAGALQIKQRERLLAAEKELNFIIEKRAVLQANAIRLADREADARSHGDDVAIQGASNAAADAAAALIGFNKASEERTKTLQNEIKLIQEVIPLTERRIAAALAEAEARAAQLQADQRYNEILRERIDAAREAGKAEVETRLAVQQAARNTAGQEGEESGVIRERIKGLRQENAFLTQSNREKQIASVTAEILAQREQAATEARKELLTTTQAADAAQRQLSAAQQQFIEIQAGLQSLRQRGAISEQEYAESIATTRARFEGMSNALRENITSSDQQIKVLKAQIAEFEKLGDTLTVAQQKMLEFYNQELIKQENIQKIQQMGQSIGDNVGQSLEDVVFSAKRAGEALKALASEVIKEFLRISFIQPIASGIAGGFAGLFGTAASGGYRSGLTLVGELGPELVDFNRPARVYTSQQLGGALGGGGGGGTIFNFNIESTDGPGVERAINAAYPHLVEGAKNAVQSEMTHPGAFQDVMRRYS